MLKLEKYRKTIVALAGAAIAILINHFGTDSIVVLDAIVVATALGVYQVPNKR